MASENSPDPAGDKAATLLAVRDTRERVIACLSDEFAHDRLELEEFERRLGVAHRSDSLAELRQLTSDRGGEVALAVAASGGLAAPAPESAGVPVPAAAPVGRRAEQALAAAPESAVVPAGRRAEQTLAAVLGGTMRHGRWTPPQKLRVVAVLGGVELDFREAVLAPGVTEVHATVFMGGVSIIVPPQLAVEMDGIAIMGGFAHTERAPAQADPDRPVLRVTGVAVMGGVEIRTCLVGESQSEVRQRRRALGGKRRALSGSRRAALPPHQE